MSRTPLARHKRLKQRRTEPRRTRHPFPLPTGSPITEAEVLGEAQAFGPQAELCRRTKCVACFAVSWWRKANRREAVPWSLLPKLKPGDRSSHAHHEPHRSTRGDTHDEDTIPLCDWHHIDGPNNVVRHRVGFTDAQNAQRFYGLIPFDWKAARDEMRRRVANKSLAASAAKGVVLTAAPADTNLPGDRAGDSCVSIPGEQPTRTP